MRTTIPLLIVALIILTFAVNPLAGADDDPALPAGLEETESSSETEPVLPAGLDGTPSDEPDLPMGLEQQTQPAEQPVEEKTFYNSFKDAGFAGFLEVRGGVRTQDDPFQDSLSMAEARLQLEWQKDFELLTAKFTGDFIYDHVISSQSEIDLRRGLGWFDLREAWMGFSPLKSMDVKLGRQILTWGTGDLLFVNDLFPKDWQSFFIGRDLEYLKAPSDAVKVSMFSDLIDVDLVYMPLMNPSRFISGERLSYYNKSLGRLAGQDVIIEDQLSDDPEFAARISRQVNSYELAGYGFWGHYKTPEGFDAGIGKAFYPRLNTYGASVRGPLLRGIANFEGAYYDSVKDRDGDDPSIPNSQVVLLTGYEMDLPEIASELTIGMQYFVEIMMNHDAYLDTLPAGMNPADEFRHVLTLRLTKQMLNQTLTLGLFTFYSPSDQDGYLRPKAAYKIDDNWTTELGANVFFGDRTDTFFGQFSHNSNVYASLRCSY